MKFLQIFSSVFQDVAHFFAQDSAKFQKILKIQRF